MKTINIQTDTKLSQIIIGESFKIFQITSTGKAIIITDDNILKLL